MTAVVLALLALSSAFLFAYGTNLLYLSWRAAGLRAPAPPSSVPAGDEPDVTVQVPIYNERYVAAKVIDAVAALDWPPDRLHVDVLDDSDDETVGLVAARVAGWRRRGLDFRHVRRPDRSGYKAGALAHGLTLTESPLVAIFDADFRPPRDFLRRTAGAFSDPAVGFVQARWGHLNERYSVFTRLQALMIDFHFLVEQAVRPAGQYMTNFAGTAGIWRRAAIVDGGGWSSATLTEDLELSYRVQLRGWRAVYVEGLVVPQELPVSVNAYRSQQARWATGSIQCALRLLGPVLRSTATPGQKYQAAMHLLAYLAPSLMLLQLACYPWLLAAKANHDAALAAGVPVYMNLLALAPLVGCAVAQRRAGAGWWRRLPAIVGWSFMGAGTSATVLAAVARAARPGGTFSRTPKFDIQRQGDEWRDRAYIRLGDVRALVELALGLGGVLTAVAAVRYDEPAIVVYALLFGLGFLYLSLYSSVQALEVLTVRRLGLRTLRLFRRSAPVALILALPALLLLGVGMLPLAFEDSYQHWLIAATLAETGRLRDPLFGMEDTWLPGYHVLAAAVLRVAGLWNIGALRFVNEAIALATLAAVHALAGGGRRGVVAVLLLALNPVFLLTATSVVAEPLLTLELTAATLAALRGRAGIAGALAALACLTGTKAWLWLLLVVAAWLVDAWLRRGRREPRLRFAWLAPALALAVVLEATLGSGAHSVARAAQEAASAGVRGSIPTTPGERGADFLYYLGLSSLPLLALAPFGLAAELRGGGSARVRLLHAPAFAYLAVIVVLVTAGVYSGSHRYLYPALPALAVLAATALDGRRVAAAGGIAASALAAIAFIPVLAGLAGLDLGLERAGRAVASTPGALMTDSPVAAFASHKDPALISGSRGLPRGQTAAINRLRGDRVTALVVEDIDYYAATETFPDLARGVAVPPFQPVAGDFAVPGGKAVHAYLLPPESYCAFIGPMTLVDLDPTAQPRTGKTAALEKGAVLESVDSSLAGEGVGFGVPLVRYPDGDYFAGHAELVDLSTPGAPAWRKTFVLDLAGADDDRSFVAAPARGRIEVDYQVKAGGAIAISVRPLDLQPGYTEVVLMNEQGARFDDYADAAQTRIGAAVGSWTPVAGSWGRFRSGADGVEWEVPALPGATLHAAREAKSPAIDFSGLEYVFDGAFAGADYTVTVQKAR